MDRNVHAAAAAVAATHVFPRLAGAARRAQAGSAPESTATRRSRFPHNAVGKLKKGAGSLGA